jgi:N-acetylmuramoyl-L-alanine amidase
MKKVIFLLLFLAAAIAGVYVFLSSNKTDREATATHNLPIDEVPDTLDTNGFSDWKRPPGPPRVGLQIGHLKSSEAPDELHKIRNNTGARPQNGMSESDVAMAIANEASKVLEANGVTVDILPATVPPEYLADAFLSIHADDHTDSSKSGYKFAAPRRDYTGKTENLVRLLEKKYEDATGLARDPNITRNMRGYYAFSWWRYDHAIHPMTPGVIAETGFMSNPGDFRLLSQTPEIPGRAIAEALLEFLKSEGILS